MAELKPADVQTFTNGRLSTGNPAVAPMLNAALVVARRETGWHVSPVDAEVTITIDGPDSRILWLPTLKLVELTSVTEDGTELDLSTITVSAGDGPLLLRRVALRKKSRGWWSADYGAIEIEMSHGFTELEAADWRQAILSMVDQMSLVPVGGSGVSGLGLTQKRVDDVTYGYQPYITMAEEVLFSVSSVLDKYRLAPVEYM